MCEWKGKVQGILGDCTSGLVGSEATTENKTSYLINKTSI